MSYGKTVAGDLHEIAASFEGAAMGPRNGLPNLYKVRRAVTAGASIDPQLAEPMLEIGRRIDIAANLSSQLAAALDAVAAQASEAADIAAGLPAE